ncbi:CHASE3 domain-containing protein [Sphingobium sufflavum]|uniref:CHASE3 domain-containing protein n=1 Tax=Sphingobium sufflavum TaxID=1129547 RepID=UPI001F2BA426|nr:CHASE3 domain-containing protein [Sphingobium sufflavum]MCE7795314.1 CHASE3 domain-containing protein [Sphingobium sufflavum]
MTGSETISVTRKILPLLLGVTLLAATTISAIWLSSRQEKATGWVRHSMQVQAILGRVQLLVTGAETGQRGYVLTGDSAYLRPYQDAVAHMPTEIEALARQTSDNGRQQELVTRLTPLLRDRMEVLSASVALMSLRKDHEAAQLVRTGRGLELMRSIRSTIDAMAREEDRLLAERVAAAQGTTRVAQSVLIGSAVMVFLFALFVVPDGLRRIREIETTNHLLQSEIAERSAAQTQVRQLQKMEAVGHLTGGIAHDFNNMLAIIIGSLDLARRRLTGQEHPKLATALDNAMSGAQRAATLTARLLAFSRRQPLEPKVVDANRLVGGMSEMLRRTIGETIRVETVLAGGLWAINADPQQIENAIINLAVNARDAMPAGGRLTIETANAELDDRYARAHEEVTAGQYVVISITDTGTGMTQEVMDRAFEPFFTTKQVGQGTGLGLSQVFGFAKQSHGHIKIYSELGAGTTIKVYLPRHVGATIAESPARIDETELPLGQAGEIVLVVEDEANVRRMSVDALRDLGYTVIHAEDAQRALGKLASHPSISLLFTDVIMPGMTGRELVDKARAERPDLRVLYTTGYTRNAIVHSGVVDHDVHFLSKPFTVAALARKVREVLNAA